MADEGQTQAPGNDPNGQGGQKPVIGLDPSQMSAEDIAAAKAKHPWWDGKPISLDRMAAILDERRKFKVQAEQLGGTTKELEDLRKYREENERKNRTEIENAQADLAKERDARSKLEAQNLSSERKLLAFQHGAKSPEFAEWYIERAQAKDKDADPVAIIEQMKKDHPEQFGATSNGGGETKPPPDPKAAAQGGAGAMSAGEKGMTLQEVEKAIDDLKKSGISGPQFLRQHFILLRLRERLQNNEPPDREAAQRLKEEQARAGGQRGNANQ